MYSSRWLILLFALFELQICLGSDIEEICLQECNISSDEVKKFDNKDDNPPTTILCYTKCQFTKLGYLKEDGAVPVDDIMKNIRKGNVAEEKSQQFENCLRLLPKIDNVEDMALMLACFKDS